MSGGSFNYLYLQESGEIISSYSLRATLNRMASTLIDEGFRLTGIHTYLFYRNVRTFVLKAWELEKKMRIEYEPKWEAVRDQAENRISWISSNFLIGDSVDTIKSQLRDMIEDYELEGLLEALSSAKSFLHDLESLNKEVNSLENVREELSKVWKAMEYYMSSDSGRAYPEKEATNFENFLLANQT